MKAENSGGEIKMSEEEKLEELRGKSTMPDRFRHLTKDAPSPPLRWPWFVGLSLSLSLRLALSLVVFIFFILLMLCPFI